MTAASAHAGTVRPSGPSEDFAAILASWRSIGRPLVQQHFDSFQKLLKSAEELLAQERLAAAATTAQLAATHAVLWHPGQFASQRLEAILRAIGRQLPHGASTRPWAPPAKPWPEILHIATRVGRIGGHGRMMQRWIELDSGHRHSVALTRQFEPVPTALVQATTRSGGRLHQVNQTPGGLLAWALRLRDAMRPADLVILHVHNMDIVPFLALAGLDRPPRVILLDHADHLFWLGASFADLIVNTRLSGATLCTTRRNVDKGRNALLPLALAPTQRKLPLAEAKRKLGLPERATVLLSVARAIKFQPLGGMSFADAHVPVLRRHPDTVLVALGPGGTVDWSDAILQLPGRILAFPEQSDTGSFLDAADIYVDSFPFTSITSLFEAGLHGLPLVTRFPFGDDCAVFGSDLLSVDQELLRTRSLDDYHATLGRLIDDPKLRHLIGHRTRARIEAAHMGETWLHSLHAIYRRALDAPPAMPPEPSAEHPSFADIDLFLPFVFGNEDKASSPGHKLALVTELEIRVLPFTDRLRACVQVARSQEFTFRGGRDAWRYLVPEWLGPRLCKLRAGLASRP